MMKNQIAFFEAGFFNDAELFVRIHIQVEFIEELGVGVIQIEKILLPAVTRYLL
jgi:hypothetical protein